VLEAGEKYLGIETTDSGERERGGREGERERERESAHESYAFLHGSG